MFHLHKKETKEGRGASFFSIRMKFSLIFILILMGVIGALILVNANFLETYTIQRKLSRIEEIVHVVENYVDSDWDDDASVEMEKVTHNSNISVVILNNLSTLPQVVYASDINEGGRSNNMVNYFNGASPVATEVYLETEDYIIYKSYDQRLGSYQIDCIGLVGDDNDTGFVMSTPLESIRETVQLTNRLLIILGLIAAVIGAVIIYLVTASLTRPILELSGLSEEMAHLNFDARYQGRQKNEIGVLGESMNQMSDRLHETIENLRTANEQLEKDLKEKERIDEMRRLFLSNVSHELKTPIALIQGYSEGLKDGITEDPESMEFYCDVIIDEAQKMNTIVKRLLNLDEIETGNMQMNREVFNLSEVLEGVAKSSRMLADEDCELVMNFAPEIMVDADEFMIEQVVQNYLSNAYHYVGHPGTVTVTAEVWNGTAHVSVHNTGSYIPEEDIDHVWDKFYKVDKARTRAYGGSGIGLSIVKAIMHNHGCPYGVSNRDGGVDFWFELPIRDPGRESGDA